MKQKRFCCALLALLLALALCAPTLAAEPAGCVTRGAFLSALYARCADPARPAEQGVFTDVPADGALARAICWAVESGIVNGYGNGLFGPDDPLTREQMAAMLLRCAQALGQAPEGNWMFPLGAPDAGEIAAYAQKGVQWAVMNRILSETADGLRPKAAVTEDELDGVLELWQQFAAEGASGRGILILYTSDVHCGIDQGFGYAGLEEVRNALTKQGYDVILVDDGDSIQGEAVGTMTQGEAILDLMNAMGYGVAIPGNHEFDYGMERFLTLTEKAAFPYISCNFNYKGELVLAPYVIRELGGKKIGFVGVTTPETTISSTPGHFMDESGEFVYGFLQDASGEAVYSAVQSAADAARAEGADYVIVLGHMGNEAESFPWTYGDVISHTDGIDAFLDGHSHDTDQVLVKNRDGRPVPRSACGTKLASIGWCRIAPDSEITTGLYTWHGKTSAAALLGLDNEMARAVSAASESLNEKLEEVVAHADVTMTIFDPVEKDADGQPIRMVRRAETNLGDLCADAFRDQSGADIAFVNGGGVRVSIDAGDITLRSLFNVQPFGNQMCVVEVTGQQILDALEWGARAVPGECGGFLQVSGLTYEVRCDLPSPCVADENGMFANVAGERRVRNVMVNGEPIDPEKTYTLAGHNYMLLGHGDGFTMFDESPLLLDCVKLDNQVLIDYITQTLGGVIGEAYADPYGQGRITIITDTP